jgi:hypothetical protein
MPAGVVITALFKKRLSYLRLRRSMCRLCLGIQIRIEFLWSAWENVCTCGLIST